MIRNMDHSSKHNFPTIKLNITAISKIEIYDNIVSNYKNNHSLRRKRLSTFTVHYTRFQICRLIFQPLMSILYQMPAKKKLDMNYKKKRVIADLDFGPSIYYIVLYSIRTQLTIPGRVSADCPLPHNGVNGFGNFPSCEKSLYIYVFFE